MKRFNAAILSAALAVVSAAAADSPKNEAAKAELTKLQGTWQVTSLTDELGPHRGKDVEEWTFEFSGDTAVNRKDRDSRGRRMVVALDPGKTPKAIDLTQDGLVIEGIYKLDGDTLTFCLVTGSRGDKTAPRPTEFKADKAKKYSLFVLKRVKK
jgi:uncharacterized protein (TIGR03067 family)